jgi:hypothetical protein
MGTKQPTEHKQRRQQTPTFLLELPLAVNAGQAKRIRGHLEAGRQFYNAVLSAGQQRLRRMRADPAWQDARAIPRTQKQERRAAFSALRERHGFSEYAFHELARELRVSWIAEHLDAVLAQTLASRAYHALNRVCVGAAGRVRFKSRGRGLGSIENKRNDTGLRFVLQQPEEGNRGVLLWKEDRLEAVIDWEDEVVTHALRSRIKYARLVQRKASSERAEGADTLGVRYVVQLACEGVPHHKPKHAVGSDTIGADLGPSTIALVPRAAEASLTVFCEELAPDEHAIRRLQRRMDRQRRAANPDNYDAQGRIKKGSKTRLCWKTSKNYEQTRRRKAAKERKLAARRKSLHGHKVHEIIAVGNTVILEKLSYKAWQKQYGRSVGLRAPGMFVELLRRTGAAHGRHPARSSHAASQTQPVLSRLRRLRQKAALPAISSLPMRDRAGATGLILCLSGRVSISRSTHPIVSPVCHSLGRCGSAPAGRARTGSPTCERGAVLAPKHGYPPCRSTSASKSVRTHTRADVPRSTRTVGSVEGTPEPLALMPGSVQNNCFFQHNTAASRYSCHFR